jgi:hypothetical protein
MLLCDAIVMDPITRKKTYVGEIRELHAAKLPAVYPVIRVHASLTNLRGRHEITVAIYYERAPSAGVVHSDKQIVISDDSTGELDFDTTFRDMKFAASGIYRFTLFADNVPIASRRIIVLTPQRPPEASPRSAPRDL